MYAVRMLTVTAMRTGNISRALLWDGGSRSRESHGSNSEDFGEHGNKWVQGAASRVRRE